jgi:hypothetical protein
MTIIAILGFKGSRIKVSYYSLPIIPLPRIIDHQGRGDILQIPKAGKAA